MVGEAFAGIGAFKTMLDVLKGMKDLNDATTRNAAVIELQQQMLTAQQEQMSLIARVVELEGRLAKLQTWQTEKARYRLTQHGEGSYSYVLRYEAQDGEPIHNLCPTCFQQDRKAILQTVGAGAIMDCPVCKTRVVKRR